MRKPFQLMLSRKKYFIHNMHEHADFNIDIYSITKNPSRPGIASTLHLSHIPSLIQ